MNKRISQCGLDAMTTAAVVAYYSQESKVKISYAGHPPALYMQAGDKVWSYARPPQRKGQSDGFPQNIPLAIDLDTLYSQLTISVAPGDRIFVYTDGVIDAPNSRGESFGLARLKDALDANTGAPLSELKAAVLKILHKFSENEPAHDDVTMIAMEIC